MAAGVGDPVPDFTLPDQHGRPTSLSSMSGRVLIVFFPAAFTPVCHDELRDLAGLAGRIKVVAISCDSMFVLRALDEAEGFGFPLLSDFWPHGHVARAFDAFHESTGTARRVTVLADVQDPHHATGARGRIAARWESTPDRPRDPGGYLQALDAG